MIEFEIKLDGLKEVIDRLEAGLPAAVDAMAASVLGEADKRVPVDTGDLKRSGRVLAIPAHRNARAIRYGGKEAPYAGIVHDGDGKGRQYLRDAAMEGHRQHLAAAAAAVADVLAGLPVVVRTEGEGRGH